MQSTKIGLVFVRFQFIQLWFKVGVLHLDNKLQDEVLTQMSIIIVPGHTVIDKKNCLPRSYSNVIVQRLEVKDWKSIDSKLFDQ